ncbi:MAG TPA: 50S ribosomal protein L18 [Myxococcota bacterium]|jgi:large subunit ribosomal protein L18|nr:50S ribosomal protein L18 [Myxococcota bacterium]
MGLSLQKKNLKRIKRKNAIRRKISGTAVRPRMTVFRSAKHMYAQVVDDEAHVTLALVSTLSKEVREQLKAAKMKKLEQAKAIGKAIAAACKAKGIETVVFDRNGFRFHGRVAAVAAAAREAGLRF